MSENWGYVCQSHDPELVSERWLNHGEDVLIDLFHKVRNGEWPQASDLVPHLRLAYAGEPAPMTHVQGRGCVAGYAVPVPPQPGGGAPPWSGPPAWLAEHPRCKVALRNEYGDVRVIADTVQGSVAPPAVEA